MTQQKQKKTLRRRRKQSDREIWTLNYNLYEVKRKEFHLKAQSKQFKEKSFEEWR